MKQLFFLALAGSLCSGQEGWRAGTAKVQITPLAPLWLAGFASRTRASEGVLAPIYVKALALSHGGGKVSVLVTADMLGFTDSVSEIVAMRVKAEYGIEREDIIFNASHTHWGPVIGRQLRAAYPMTPAQWADVDDYTSRLTGLVGRAIGQAVNGMQPAALSYGETQAGFAANYRLKTEKGYVHRPNPAGLVDKRVPVLRVDGADGRLLAVVFGYSCHPTVATGAEDLYVFHGDYAGFAQALLEQEFSDATALFVQGFGGDAKADPRGSVALARRHGAELAGAVSEELRRPMQTVNGPIHAVFDRVTLEFDAPPVQEWKTRALSPNPNIGRQAEAMMEQIARNGKVTGDYSYPMQLWRFGDSLALMAMGGETLAGYGVRFRRELGLPRLWLAGYSNDVSCYIPPVPVLDEGGYEPDESMIYYARPGPFKRDVEERIVSKAKEMVRR